MSDEDNWPGWAAGTPMHPRSRAHGAAQVRTVIPAHPSGLGGHWLPHPESPAGRRLTHQDVVEANEQYRASMAIQGAHSARRVQALTELASVALDRQCFSLGVAYGLVKSPVADAVDTLELVRVFVMADLYDRIYGHHRWLGPIPPLGTGLAIELGVRAALSMGLLERHWLEQAHQEVSQMIAELDRLLEDPLEYLGGLPEQVAHGYKETWHRYKTHNSQRDPLSQFHAGEAIGELLYEVLSVIIGLVTTAGAAAKLASKSPQLLKAARSLGRRPTRAAPPGKGGPAKTTPQKATPPDRHKPAEKTSDKAKTSRPPEPPRIRASQRLKAVDDGALHNQEWDRVEVKDFQAKREGLNLRKLSSDDAKARKLLEESGYDREKVEEVLNSGHSFEPNEFKKGDKLYAFDSADWSGKEQGSPYWLDQDAYDNVAKLHRHGDSWDRQGVKNTLALPCYNKADGLVRAQVAESHVGVRSVVGKATENVTYKVADGKIVPKALSLPGGGHQLTPGLGQVVPIGP